MHALDWRPQALFVLLIEKRHLKIRLSLHQKIRSHTFVRGVCTGNKGRTRNTREKGKMRKKGEENGDRERDTKATPGRRKENLKKERKEEIMDDKQGMKDRRVEKSRRREDAHEREEKHWTLEGKHMSSKKKGSKGHEKAKPNQQQRDNDRNDRNESNDSNDSTDNDDDDDNDSNDNNNDVQDTRNKKQEITFKQTPGTEPKDKAKQKQRDKT